MEDVYELIDIGNSPDANVNQNEVFYESEKLWLRKTVSQCQNLLEKLKSEAEIKEAHDKSNLHAEKSLNQELHSNKNYDDDDEIDEKSSHKGNLQDILVTGEPKTKKKKLSDEQKTLINKLKNTLRSSTQLLAMVQGEAGSGKTTIARTFAKQLKLETMFSASTGAAAAPLKALTINSLLSLGLSKDKVKPGSDRTTPNIKARIEQLFEDVQVLIIDEISMCTPVTVARIEKRLRVCLDPNKHFGGLHIIFLGDFWQFKPVSFLRKPALYQGLVLQAKNNRLEENEAYRTGVNLFSMFKVFFLKGQQRATEANFREFVRQLRDESKTNPITKD